MILPQDQEMANPTIGLGPLRVLDTMPPHDHQTKDGQRVGRSTVATTCAT